MCKIKTLGVYKMKSMQGVYSYSLIGLGLNFSKLYICFDKFKRLFLKAEAKSVRIILHILIASCCSFVLVSPLFLLNAAYCQQPVPRIFVPELNYNFGSVAQGSIVEHNFEISNLGDASLKITKVHPSCGCTAAILDSDVVGPGEKTALKVSFNTAGFEGEKVKTIRIYTDDPAQTSLLFRIEGEIKTEFVLDPVIVDFKTVRAGRSDIKSVKVYADNSLGIKFIDVSSNSPDIEVDVKDLVLDNKSGKDIIVKLKETASIGMLRTRLVVKTSSSKTPVINIPVSAHVEGDLRVAPADVTFDLLTGPLDQTISKSIVFSNLGKTPVKILEIKSDHPSVTSSYTVVRDGFEYSLVFEIRKNTIGIVRDRIRIITDHPDKRQSELIVPLTAIISRDSK